MLACLNLLLINLLRYPAQSLHHLRVKQHALILDQWHHRVLGFHLALARMSQDVDLSRLVGVQDFIYVDTGDAVLICAKERSQDVKIIVEQLMKSGMDEYI